MSGVAIIPARGGSSRIPRKNIRPFHGKPIIEYGIKAAIASGLFDRVVVSTEDAEIASIAEGCDAEVLERPPELAQNAIGTQLVMQHAVNALDLPSKCEVCCIYPAAPLITADDIRGVQEKLLWGQGKFCYVNTVGTEPLRDIGWLYYGTAGAFSYGTALWACSFPYPIDECRAIDINTAEDWRKAEEVYAMTNNKRRAA